MTKDTVTVYATTWCPFCKKLLAGLRAESIPFIVIDVDEDDDAANWVESVNGGNRVVPTVRYADGRRAHRNAASRGPAGGPDESGARRPRAASRR